MTPAEMAPELDATVTKLFDHASPESVLRSIVRVADARSKLIQTNVCQMEAGLKDGERGARQQLITTLDGIGRAWSTLARRVDADAEIFERETREAGKTPEQKRADRLAVKLSAARHRVAELEAGRDPEQY